MSTPGSGSPRWIPEAPTAAVRRDHPSRYLTWLRDRNPLFARLSEGAARLLFECATWRIEPRSCVLTRTDDPAVQAFIVVDGVVVQRLLRGARVRELAKVGLLIWGNHAIRASVGAMRKTFAKIRKDGGIHTVESEIPSVDEIFDLQGMGKVKADEKKFLK